MVTRTEFGYWVIDLSHIPGKLFSHTVNLRAAIKTWKEHHDRYISRISSEPQEDRRAEIRRVACSHMNDYNLYINKYAREAEQRGVASVRARIQFVETPWPTDEELRLSLRAIRIEEARRRIAARRIVSNANGLRSSVFAP